MFLEATTNQQKSKVWIKNQDVLFDFILKTNLDTQITLLCVDTQVISIYAYNKAKFWNLWLEKE